MASSGTFSYAQAAKGLAPSTQTNSAVPSSASSEHGGKDESATSQIQSTQTSLVSEQRKSSLNTTNNTQAAEVGGSKTAEGVTQEQSQVTTSSKSAVHVDAKPQFSVDATVVGSNDKSGSVEADAPAGEDDKVKDADDDWEKVSVPSVTTEKELKAAPPPSVNIWQQRKEAQEAKQKELASQRVVPVAAPPKVRNSTSASTDDSRRKSNTRDVPADKESAPAQRRVNSGSRASADRKEHNSAQLSPRSLSQQGPKPATPLRPATDNEFWPTPDSVTTDERRRSTIYEKADKTDKSDTKAGTQKKWVQMPFTPTIKFETQLPPAAARRGGRAGNRVRGGGQTTGHNNVTEKSEAGSMGPPPLPNKSSEDRGRKNTGSQAARSSSVPTQSNRTSGAENEVRDVTRSSIAHTHDASGSIAAPESTFQTVGPVASEEANTNEASRSSSRHNNGFQNTRRRFDGEPKDAAQTQSSNAQPTFDGSARSNSERYRGPAHDSSRASVDFSAQAREWSRGRSDAPREKGESWRGREPRPDRGRGGYRGRGNHSSYNSNPSAHGFTAPLPQTGFDSSKSTPHESRNRQVSYPSFPPSPSINGRNNPRSQSIPMTVSGGTYYNPMPGFPQALSPTDMNFVPYQGVMHGGIMPAMPYAEPLSSYALLSMIITQLEYYFSIDNLCKDMFLRKNMDSQGYVPLSVITNFKRIKALTEGQMPAEQLRSVCQQARNIEFVTSDDGEDKLRSRDNWRDFVLPMEERLPAAQNDGPTIRTAQQPTNGLPMEFMSPNGGNARTASNGYSEQYGQQMSPAGFPHIPAFDGSADFQPGRSDSHAADQMRRISTTSPLSKVQSPSRLEHARSPSGYMSNGHHHSLSNAGIHDNMFPDEKIPELKVVVRDPTFESNPEYANEAAPLGLRGGAGSVEHLEQFRNLQFGRAISAQPAYDPEQPSYFTRDGQIGQIPTGPGFVHEEYLPLHAKAVSQRSENHLSGALLVLYAFWSSFLVENFNSSMYEEFSAWANEDLQAGNENGKAYLLKYYEKLLTSKLAMSDRLASDIVKLARKETGEHRPTWQKLRTAWRNGATNLKTRKRLADVLTAEEQTELDKSV